MFRRRSGHRLNVLHTFNLRSVSSGAWLYIFFHFGEITNLIPGKIATDLDHRRVIEHGS